MLGVPTPMAKVLSSAGTENDPRLANGCGVSSESGRLAELVAAVQQPDAASNPGKLLPHLTELRKVLSTELAPPIDKVLALGALPPLLSLLNVDSAAIQLEAAWAVTQIAGGSSQDATVVLEAGCLPAVFTALQSPSVPERADLCSQLLWVLGNIAGDADVHLRDRLLDAEVVGHLGLLYSQIPGFSWSTHGRTQVLRTLTWLMSCLCGGRPAPKLQEVDCAFDYFAQVVTGTDDTEMLSEALWGLYHLLDGATSEEDADARVARMLSAGFGEGEGPPENELHPVVVQVVSCLSARSDRISAVDPAMKILGALVSASDDHCTDLVIAAGALKALRCILADVKSPAQRRENAAWTLSNIAAGCCEQAQNVLDESGVYEALCAALERGTTQEVRRECAWAVANLAKQGTPILSRVDCRELLRLLTVALSVTIDTTLQRGLLEAAEAVLDQTGSRGLANKQLVRTAKSLGFVDVLEELQHSESDSIYRKAAHLIEQFLTDEPRKDSACKSFATANSGICGGGPIHAGYLFGA